MAIRIGSNTILETNNNLFLVRPILVAHTLDTCGQLPLKLGGQLPTPPMARTATVLHAYVYKG